MKIEVGSVRLSQGGFTIQYPDQTGLNVPGQDKAVLVVACEYVLEDGKGVQIAQGKITNSPDGGGVRPSEETLKAFGHFFRSLEHDVASALSADGGTTGDNGDDESVLAGYLGE